MSKLDYPYIRAWGQLVNSSRMYITHLVHKAQTEHAPQDVIYYGRDSIESDQRWHRLGEITRTDTLSLLEKIKAGQAKT